MLLLSCFLVSPSDTDLLNVLIELAHSSACPLPTHRQKELISPSSSSSSSLFSNPTRDSQIPLQSSVVAEELNEVDTVSLHLETESDRVGTGSRLSSVDLLDDTEDTLFDDSDDDLIPGNQQHSQSPLKKQKETSQSPNESRTLISSLVFSCTQEMDNDTSIIQQLSLGSTSQSSPTQRVSQLPALERRRLLQLCSSELESGQWEQEVDEEDCIEEEERESFIMTQPVWDDVEDSDRYGLLFYCKLQTKLQAAYKCQISGWLL